MAGVEKVSSGDHTYGAVMDDSLPSGWTRKVIQRTSGKSAGKYDVYIYSPDGKKFRSRRDLETYKMEMGLDLNINDFNFSVRGAGNTPAKTSPGNSSGSKTKKTSAKKSSSSEKASESKTKKKTGKNVARNLVVKMSFPTPSKRKSARQNKMANKGKMRRSNSVSAVLLSDTKSARKAQGKADATTLQRSVSLELGKTGRSPKSPTRKEGLLVIRSCKLSPKESSPNEKNNNDVNWKSLPSVSHKLGKRKGSQCRPTAEEAPQESPGKVRRKMSSNTPDELPRSRRLSSQESSRPVKGEEIVVSKKHSELI